MKRLQRCGKLKGHADRWLIMTDLLFEFKRFRCARYVVKAAPNGFPLLRHCGGAFSEGKGRVGERKDFFW